MAEDDRPGNFIYFVSHPDTMDVPQLWRTLGTAVGKRVLLVPLPRWVLYVAMRVATAAAKVIPFRNQLDRKQYEQIVAPAFVCSSQALRDDLGWTPRYPLDDAVTHAAEGYRAAGLLKR